MILLLMQPRAYNNLRLLLGIIDRIPEPSMQMDNAPELSNSLLSIDLTDDEILMDIVRSSSTSSAISGGRMSELFVGSPITGNRLSAALLDSGPSL